MRRAGLALAFAGAALASAAPARAAPQAAPAAPFKAGPTEPLDFRGPGRQDAPPDVTEVVIGWFGPADPAHVELGEYYRGALLALAQENAAGGFDGRPFRLEAAWSERAWTAGIVDLTRLVYDRHAWAVIGGLDGAATHLAVQVALKSRFLLLSPGSSDSTADAANVAWLFSLPPADEAQAEALVPALADAAAGGSCAIAAATDHDSRAALVAFRRELGRRGLAPAALVEFAPGEPALEPLAARLIELRPKALLVIAPARAAGRLVAELRRAGFEGAIAGGASFGLAAFHRAAGDAVEGVIAPRTSDTRPDRAGFAESYAGRWGEAPDAAAARGYDAVRMVAAAVRNGGLNRARIRDALRALAPWQGASGEIVWDARGRGRAAVASGSWRAGRFE